MPTQQQIKQIIVQELPIILQQDTEIKDFVLQLSRRHFADKKKTESRFDRMLDELRRDREEQSRRWDAQEQKWKERQLQNQQRWEEQNHKWEEQNRKWEEHQREDKRMWEEHQREERQKWAEYRIESNRRLEAIEKLGQKYDSSIGALGARWGLHSEAAFRNGLKAILEESFDVQVLNVTEYDEQGDVFGHPEQIEMDIVIKDGLLIICEIKSSTSKADMYILEHKARFYEKLHDRTVDRIMVISPMLGKGAQAAADSLDIQTYSYADTVAPEVFD